MKIDEIVEINCKIKNFSYKEINELFKSESSLDIFFKRDDNNVNYLMKAARNGQKNLVQYLLNKGIPWNELDKENQSAGDYCRDTYPEIYDLLVNHGVRAEMILNLIEQKQSQEKNINETDIYLNNPLIFKDEHTILDSDKNAVMMGWETPLMYQHAKLICKNDGKILNIGFGLGIIDKFIQNNKNIDEHHIIEAHPDIYAKMLENGWDKISNVTIHYGKWQDILPTLSIVFDGIFFDTFSEHYKDMKEFHDYLPNILHDNGIYSFFNGLCASTNQFFHDVYKILIQLELKQEYTINTHYLAINISPNSAIWQDSKRPYWVLDTYYIPICQFEHNDSTRLIEFLATSINNAS